MLQKTIDQDIKSAMLAKNSVRLRGLRAIKAALLQAKTEKGASEILSSDTEIKVLQKLIKQRKESAGIYLSQNRSDLEKIENEEMEVIGAYLPKQMEREAITEHVKKVIVNTGTVTAKDMGKIIGLVNKDLAGKADGKMISEVIKELLTAL